MPKEKILAVEDEGIVALSLKQSLERLGYAVPAIAATGEDAIQKAAEHLPDLVLMDIMLQGEMDGIEAASRIRSELHIPVVYLTAYSDEKILERAKPTEPLAYILKPFQERGLAATIEMALHQHKTLKQRILETDPKASREIEPHLQKPSSHPGSNRNAFPTKINLSKLSPPHLTFILNRTHLLNLIESNKDKKLTLLIGQAAQGKTTLAASYVKRTKIPSAWVSLDKDDSDPFALFSLITQSLQHGFRDIDVHPPLAHPQGRMSKGQEMDLYRHWVRSLFEPLSLPGQIIPRQIIPRQIIIDGLNTLSPDAPAFKFLQVLVDEAPPNIRLILLSREFPPLRLEHLKIKGETFVLDNQELALTKSEAGEFIKKKGYALPSDQLEKIYASTEGWIGALILFWEYLNRFKDKEPLRKKQELEDIPGHFKREIFQFFNREVFSAYTPKVQKFLIKLSLFEPIEPRWLKEVLGIDHAETILEELARKNLFIQSIHDEKKGRVFRYQPLFRDFLKNRLDSEMSHQERQALFLKAGFLYEQKGDLEKALNYFLEARAYPQAVSVIERLGMTLLQQERKETLFQWTNAFPKGVLRKNPWLLLFQALTNPFMLGMDNVVAFKRAYTLFKKKREVKGELLSLAHLILASLYAGIAPVSMEKLSKEGESLLQSSEWVDYQYEKTVLWCILGLDYITREGDIQKGIAACQNAHILSKQFNHIHLQAYVLSYMMLGLTYAGDYDTAHDISQKIEALIKHEVDTESRVIHLYMKSTLIKYQGDFVAMEDLIEKLKQEIEKNRFVFIYPWIYESSGYLMLSRGDFKEAVGIGKKYLTLAITLDNALLKSSALRLLGLVYLHQGDLPKAFESVDQSVFILSTSYQSTYMLNRTRVIMGLICLHQKKYKQAEKDLGEALHYFASIMSYSGLAETHFVMALLKWDEGKAEEAAFHLEAGFKIAEAKTYDHFYSLGGTYLKKACLLAMELTISGAMDYAAHLLSTRLSLLVEGDLEKQTDHPDSRVRIKVAEIRRTIHRSRIPRLRIETLGGFRVLLNASLINDSEWKRNQPKKLLKAIVAHGGQKIPIDHLIEDLWPEVGVTTGENNFKTTLYRLRKILEPAIYPEFGSSYIQLKDNLISLDPTLCQVDIDEFLGLIQRGKEKEKEGDIKKALAFYAHAIDQYRGDFFLEDFHSSSAQAKQEELRRNYIGLLLQMAILFEKQGTFKKAITCYKKSLQTDPNLEEAYQKLMILYSNSGMRNEAIRLYEEYRTHCSDHPKWEPDKIIFNHYHQILKSPPPLKKRRFRSP